MTTYKRSVNGKENRINLLRYFSRKFINAPPFYNKIFSTLKRKSGLRSTDITLYIPRQKVIKFFFIIFKYVSDFKFILMFLILRITFK